MKWLELESNALLKPSFLLALILLLLSNSVLSQKKNKKNIYPHSTSAEQRLKGYNDRLNLNSKSIVKNIRFRNIGTTVMSGRVVDLDINPDDPYNYSSRAATNRNIIESLSFFDFYCPFCGQEGF